MTRPPGVPPPESGCGWTTPRCHLCRQASRGAGLRAGARGTSGARAAAPGPGPQLSARHARRRRVPPAGGAGAGLALPAHRGGRAGDPASSAPAVRPSRLSRRPAGRMSKPASRSQPESAPQREPSGASRPGEELDHEFLERDQEKGQRTRGRQGWWRTVPRAVPSPRPAPTARGMARGPALPLLCAPAVWAAAALLLCAPQTSGRTGVPAWLTACVRPLLRHHTRAAASLSAPLASRAPPPGLLPIRRAPGRDKCFQRPGELRRRPWGAPRPWFSRIVSVNMARWGGRRRGPCFSRP